MNCIGKKIKELRIKNDMTQEKLADYLGISYQSVSKWENGITSPDLGLIVPLARLFEITTDELFDYKASVEDMKRSEFQCRYDETFRTGDLSVRLSVAKEAVRVYPGDMNWLTNYAWAVWCNAISIKEDTKYVEQREKAITLFRKVIENCGNDEIKSYAIVGIVQCLTEKGSYDEAKRYAELYPDTKLNADEKEKLLISCMIGEERIAKQQERLLDKSINIIQDIICGETSPDERITAKSIIDALIPDGNYLTFHYELYMIDLSEARAEICTGEYDNAILAMARAREHAVSCDRIKKEKHMYTAPLFNRLTYNSKNQYTTGMTTMLEEFKGLFDYPAYAP